MLLFILATLFFPDQASDVFGAVLTFINEKVGWLYIISFNIFIGAALYFALGRYGKIRLGGPGALPEFSTGAWYAMLISAGLWHRVDVLGRGRANLPPDSASSLVRSRTLVIGRGQSRTGDLLPPLGDPWMGAVWTGSPGPGILRLQPRPATDLPLGLLSDSRSEDLWWMGQRYRHPHRGGHPFRSCHLTGIRRRTGSRGVTQALRSPGGHRFSDRSYRLYHRAGNHLGCGGSGRRGQEAEPAQRMAGRVVPDLRAGGGPHFVGALAVR